MTDRRAESRKNGGPEPAGRIPQPATIQASARRPGAENSTPEEFRARWPSIAQIPCVRDLLVHAEKAEGENARLRDVLRRARESLNELSALLWSEGLHDVSAFGVDNWISRLDAEIGTEAPS